MIQIYFFKNAFRVLLLVCLIQSTGLFLISCGEGNDAAAEHETKAGKTLSQKEEQTLKTSPHEKESQEPQEEELRENPLNNDGLKKDDSSKKDALLTPALKEYLEAFPQSGLVEQASVGRWSFEAGFFDQEQEFGSEESWLALQALYQSDKTKIAHENKEKPGELETKSFHFKQEVTLLVFPVQEGEEALKKQDLEAQLQEQGWQKREPLAVLEGGEQKELAYWRKEHAAAYLYLSEKFLLYALEQEEQAVIGKGMSTKLGAQKILLFLTRYGA